MNSTNRVANRGFLVIVGLLLIAAGGAAIALAALPVFARRFASVASGLRTDSPSWVGAPAVGQVSILTLALAAVAVVLIVVLLAFILRQGRGHTSTVLRRAAPTASTTIDLGVPRSLLDDYLNDRDEFVGHRVVAYRVKRTPTLKVSVRARRGVAPSDAAAIVTEALTSLDAVLGFELPTLVQISGGVRARATRAARFS